MRSNLIYVLALLVASACADLGSFGVDYIKIIDYVDQQAFTKTLDFHFSASDPNTGTWSYCNLTHIRALDDDDNVPSTWNFCEDKTFSWKFDYSDFWDITLEVKHQYRGAGKPCVKSNGPQCTTSRGYVHLPVTEGGKGDEEGLYKMQEWSGSGATIFSTCHKGCGISSGLN
ncbi:hypothetical protein MBLNU459_g2563t1 [Dothideomycetes sp. NU459]